MNVASVLALFALIPIIESCAEDPVQSDEVTALGAEIPGIPVGEYHRAGQPCTVCHGGEGPATTQFSVAGTIFSSKGSLVGVDNAQILLTDANGSSPSITPVTNCVGNFFITPDQWNPAFPVIAGIQSGKAQAVMLTQISRASSCAECHADPPGLASVGHVYITVSVNPNEEAKCPVSPNAGGPGADF